MGNRRSKVASYNMVGKQRHCSNSEKHRSMLLFCTTCFQCCFLRTASISVKVTNEVVQGEIIVAMEITSLVYNDFMMETKSIS